MFSGCDRWEEYLMRQRVGQIGVPERLAGTCISDIHKVVKEENYESFKRFALELQHRAASAVFGGSLSQLFCVAVLRFAIKDRLSVTSRFLRAPTLIRPLKMFFAKESGIEDPLRGCEKTDLLIISDLNVKSDPDWFVEVIQNLCRSRYLESRSTVLGVSDVGHKKTLKKLALEYFGDSNAGEFSEGDHCSKYNADRHVHLCDGLAPKR
jgi:DNA replication protein DnaC